MQKMVNAEVLIGLTGTLVQNNLDEYWSLLNTVQPGCVGRQDDFKVGSRVGISHCKQTGGVPLCVVGGE